MPIIESQLVNIEIVTSSSDKKSVLRLVRVASPMANRQGKTYDLVRVFASHKLDSPDAGLRERTQQLISTLMNANADRYLLVREVGYYSLWEIDRSQLTPPVSVDPALATRAGDRDLQQASIWLFQLLWLQLEDLLGARQLELLADSLLKSTPQFHSWVDLDRLLIIDPTDENKLARWTESESIEFIHQLDRIVQKKLGREFGTKLTIEIIATMPNSSRSTLERILDFG